jgi:hypothetical protein
MKRRLLQLVSVAGLLVVFGTAFHMITAHAAFNANNLIDDAIFNNAGAMNAQQIDSWLNANFPNSCISTKNGFTNPEPTGYTPASGFTYSGNVSAGNIIYDAARVYGLNPQVILATLEKESSVVSGNASYHCSYINTSMGFDCPDSGSCPQNPATESGFSKQIIHASWMLKFHQQRSRGNINWNVQLGDFPHAGNWWDNSDDPQSCYGGRMTQGTYARCPSSASAPYDGLTAIDGSTVHLDNGATAALYDYTPHFHGNQLFDNYFIGWFGTLFAAPYTAVYYSQSAYPQINPGQQANVFLEYQNLGSKIWYDDQGLSGAPAGTKPIHLATANPVNRLSSFGSTWPGAARPAVNFSAVYEYDGVTLAVNQHVAQPGQIVKYSFAFSATTSQLAGIYNEFFQPVVEGSSTDWFNDPGTYLGVTVNSVRSLSYVEESGYPTIAPSQSQSSNYIKFKNTGNTPLYDNQSISGASPGNYPTHLAVGCPLNSQSDFNASDWSGSARPAVNFGAVYEADGTTLASNQHIAMPGQIIKFSFSIKVPNNYTAGTYKLCLQPILEGTSDGYYPDFGAFLNVSVPSIAVLNYTDLQSAYSFVSGDQKTIAVQIQNVGNANLPAGAKLTSTNATPYQDPSWPSSTTIANISSGLSPSASYTLNLNLLAPTAPEGRNDNVNLQIYDSGNVPVVGSSKTVSMQVASPSYSTAYAGQSGYPSFTYGQQQTVYFRYKNTGNKVWYDGIGVSTATSRGALPTHLATDYPTNRGSGFAYNWNTDNRPAVNFNAVFESDNSTAASNQHLVKPGQIGEFSFTMAAASWVNPGIYREFFRPIIEGTSDGAISSPGTYMDVRLNAPRYSSAYYSQSSYPSLSSGQSSSVTIQYLNNGNAPWYDDVSYNSATGKDRLKAVHLATTHLINRNSIFGATWPGKARPKLAFSAVYNNDDSTLTSDQHVVQPGQIAKYTFIISVPNGTAPAAYREFFQPIAEGTSDGAFNDPWTFLDINVQ